MIASADWCRVQRRAPHENETTSSGAARARRLLRIIPPRARDPVRIISVAMMPRGYALIGPMAWLLVCNTWQELERPAWLRAAMRRAHELFAVDAPLLWRAVGARMGELEAALHLPGQVPMFLPGPVHAVLSKPALSLLFGACFALAVAVLTLLLVDPSLRASDADEGLPLLAAWARARRRGRRYQLVYTGVAHWTRRNLSRALNTWRPHAATRKRRVRLLHSGLACLLHGCQAKAWRKWAARASARRVSTYAHKLRLVRGGAARIRRPTLCRAWHTMAMAAAVQAGRARLLRKGALHWLNSRMACAIRAWNATAAARSNRRRLLVMGLWHWSRSGVARAWCSWQCHVRRGTAAAAKLAALAHLPAADLPARFGAPKPPSAAARERLALQIATAGAFATWRARHLERRALGALVERVKATRTALAWTATSNVSAEVNERLSLMRSGLDHHDVRELSRASRANAASARRAHRDAALRKARTKLGARRLKRGWERWLEFNLEQLHLRATEARAVAKALRNAAAARAARDWSPPPLAAEEEMPLEWHARRLETPRRAQTPPRRAEPSQPRAEALEWHARNLDTPIRDRVRGGFTPPHVRSGATPSRPAEA